MANLKRLYDNQDNHTQPAMDLIEEISNALQPIIDKWYEQGFSIRDIGMLAQTGVHEAVSTKLMQTHEDRKKNFAVKVETAGREYEFTSEVMQRLIDAYSVGSSWSPGSASGNKVGMIKVIREVTGMGLKEAKDTCEHLQHEGYLPGSYSTPVAGTRITDTYKHLPPFK